VNPIMADWPVAEEVAFTSDSEVIKYFTQGQCNALAFELWKLTDWNLGLVSDEPAGNPDYSGHIFVIDQNAMVIDIRGRKTMDNFRKKWPFLPHFYLFRDIESFELEMMLWENDIHYTRDRYARRWAKYIVDILGS